MRKAYLLILLITVTFSIDAAGESYDLTVKLKGNESFAVYLEGKNVSKRKLAKQVKENINVFKKVPSGKYSIILMPEDDAGDQIMVKEVELKDKDVSVTLNPPHHDLLIEALFKKNKITMKLKIKHAPINDS